MRACVIALVVSFLCHVSLGHPGSGANCGACHNHMGYAPGVTTVKNFTLTADPKEMAGKTDLGTLKVYQVPRGGTATLTVEVNGLAAGNAYATDLGDFGQTGVVGGNSLVFRADTTWTKLSSQTPNYYVTPKYTFDVPRTFTYTIGVNPSTLPDYYEMFFQTGVLSTVPGIHGMEQFYLQVLPVSDASGDSIVDFKDYIVLEGNFGKTGATWQQGDSTGDGVVNFQDYVNLELNFGQTVPEPATLAVLAMGGLAMLRRRK